MKVYVASSLDNIENVKLFNHALRENGHEVTYDWATHGPVKHLGIEVVTETAVKELVGVLSADVVIALLPGGRGTHVEIGAALGVKIPVILHGPPEVVDFDHAEKYTAFYACCGYVTGISLKQLAATFDKLFTLEAGVAYVKE